LVLCSSLRTDGETPCRRHAMLGQNVCYKHGGMAPQNLRAAERRLAERKVNLQIERLGIPVEVEPIKALLAALYESAGICAYLRSEISKRQDTAEDGPGSVLTQHDPAGVRESALLKMYLESVERLARISKTALDAGIDERTVRMTEQQGELLVRVVEAVMADPDLQLTDSQRKAMRLSWSRNLLEIGESQP
jgi:hypothetical protein